VKLSFELSYEVFWVRASIQLIEIVDCPTGLIFKKALITLIRASLNVQKVYF
jgi:hypothetical protein